MRWMLLIVLVASTACEKPPDRDEASETTDGGVEVDGGVDGGRHCSQSSDCFSYLTCSNGTVSEWRSALPPCGQSCSYKPTVTFSCARGCRTDRDSLPVNAATRPVEMCEEVRPKKAGDACATEEDCLPTPALPDGQGNLVNTYLECDGTTCVNRPPPEVPDYLAACGEGLFDEVEPGEQGIVAAPECEGGLCLYYRRSDAACVDQGCTLRCAADQDCPNGSACVDFDEVPGACKPGGPYVIGKDLVCR